MALETNIAAISSNLDESKKMELGGLIKKLKDRAPTFRQPKAMVPDETFMKLDKLIGKLASAATGADLTCTDGLEAAFMEIEEFVLGAVEVVRKHGPGLQKKSNSNAYDHRATAAFHLLNTNKLLAQVPDDSSCPRMVNFLGGAYYRTRWCVDKVWLCSFWRTFLCGGVFALPYFYWSPFVQALPLLFDSGSAFEDVDSTNSDLLGHVLKGFPESLHLLVGFGEHGEVKCALAPSYLFKEEAAEAAEAAAAAGEAKRAFATQVLKRPVPFAAGVMQFVLTIARGTFALPLAALRKARRFERDDGPDAATPTAAAAAAADAYPPSAAAAAAAASPPSAAAAPPPAAAAAATAAAASPPSAAAAPPPAAADPSSPPEATNGGDGSVDSGAADGGTKLSDEPFSDRLTFSSNTCNMFWNYRNRKVRPRARVGELTILVSTFLTSPCFRAVCRCAQGEKCFVGDDVYNRLRKEKSKTKLKEPFATELVWFPVVVSVRGDLTTYDEPGDSYTRVTYLDRFGDVPTEQKLGWLTDQASLMSDPITEVSVACDEQYSTDGKVQLHLSRPRRDVHHDAALERTGHRWTPQNAVSFVVFVHCRLRSRRLSHAAAAVPPAVPCAVRRRTRWRCLTRSRRSTSSTPRARRPTMR